MGMVVRTNTMAINANRQLNINNNQVSKSLQKLSSGYKINSASDDASGLAISEKMKSQIAGLDTASDNAQDGISLVQTAEGATTQIHSMLNRMVELATKSANGTIQDDVDREAIQNEVDALNDEISRIATSTDFNGITLLDGSLSSTSGATIASDITTDLSYSTTAAVAGKYTTTAITTGTTFNAKGDSLSYTLSLDDGTSTTVELTQKVDANGNYYLEDQDGTTYSQTTATAVATSVDVVSALQEAFTTEVGGKFEVTASTTAWTLSFESNNEGTAAAKVTGLSLTATDVTNGAGAASAITVTTATTATDGAINIDTAAATSAITMYTGTNLNDAVFEINGKSFVTAVSTTDVSDLDSSITVLTGSTVGDALNNAANQSTVEKLTGIDVTYTAASNLLQLKSTVPDGSGQGLELQIGATSDSYNKVTVSIDNLSAEGLGVANLDVSSQDNATAAIETINTAINTVSENRGKLGALQNRLEYTIDNLDNTSENISSANSAIRDTDMATEMMSYTQSNILLQAAQSMLAQANSAPQAVLQLLQ